MAENSLPAPAPMTVAEFEKIGDALYGYGWQTRYAELLGVDPSTIRRYVAGTLAIPGPVAVAVRSLARVKQLEIKLRRSR